MLWPENRYFKVKEVTHVKTDKKIELVFKMTSSLIAETLVVGMTNEMTRYHLNTLSQSNLLKTWQGLLVWGLTCKELRNCQAHLPIRKNVEKPEKVCFEICPEFSGFFNKTCSQGNVLYQSPAACGFNLPQGREIQQPSLF